MKTAVTVGHDFLITDPLLTENIVDWITEGVKMVGQDDIPYRAELQVHCTFCKQRQPHNDGYFAILSEGSVPAPHPG